MLVVRWDRTRARPAPPWVAVPGPGRLLAFQDWRGRPSFEPGIPGTLRVVTLGVVVGTSGTAVGGRPTATRPGVELALVWAFLGLRAFVLAQAAVAVAAGSLSRSDNPQLDAALLGAMAVESLLLGRWLIRRRSMLPFRWPIAADFGLSVSVLALAPAYIPAVGRINGWTIWAYPVALSTTLLVGTALASLAQALAVSGALSVAYAAAVAVPLFGDPALRMTTVVNATTFPGFAVLAFLVSRFIRELASGADAVRKRIAELEQDRSRALIHDLLVYLRLDRFAQADDETRAVMIAQAQAKHEQMRSYVDGTGGTPGLPARIDAVLRLHPGLPVSSQVEVGPDVQLTAETLEQLEHALDTALANAEQHAPGANVVLSVRSVTDHLSVTVRDDGPGFNAANTQQGFGISEILGRQLAGVGGTGVVESSPGTGTLVRIMVPVEQP
jgi:signal transduction histidine kinase